MDVELEQLEYFRTVGRLQHVTRASEQLGITQPALSRAIIRLERELGAPLFHHVGRSVRLTRYGETFLERVEGALREIEEGRRALADMTGEIRGTIALGFLRTLGAEYVPRLVHAFRRDYPDVRFVFTQNNGSALEQLLHNGDLDCALLSGPPADARLAWSHVFDQRLVAIVPRDHRLAKRRTIRLAELAGDPFISFKPGHAIREVTDELCAAAGFAPPIAFEGDESSSIRGFVAQGFGVAIVPDTRAAGAVVSLRISTPAARRAMGVAWIKDRYQSGAERAFRRFAVELGASV
jgi:DNA-binding transcriptional LysR family regulator